MPLRTWLFSAALDRFDGQPITGLDLPGIRRNRAKVPPAVPPFTWITGPVFRDVRDEGGPTIAHQALMYPGTDSTMSQPSIVEHADAPILTRAKIDVFLGHYLGPRGLSADDPLVSPLWAKSHAGLPPALVQTADLDPLRDEGRLYAERLATAGVPVRHTNYVCVPHGFASFPGATTNGRQHRAELVDQLRRYLHP